MLGALIDLVLDLDRKVLVGGILLVVLVFAVIGFFLFSGGGGPPGGAVDLGEQIDFSAVAPSGEPGSSGEPGGSVPPPLLDESVVAERVAATIEAMVPAETPAPTLTPDIAATLQAELRANRARSDRILQLGPLDSREARNPYLTASELDHIIRIGPVLWAHTKAWLHVQELLSLGVSDWSSSSLGFHVSQAEGHVEPYVGRAVASPDRRGVGELVSAYTVTVEEGMRGVRSSVSLLSKALRILEMSDTGQMVDLPFEDRQEIAQLAQDAEDHLVDFDDSMSQYGCSICGELFRLRWEE